MPKISERQALIHAILIATQDETRQYFGNFETDDDFLEDDFEDPTLSDSGSSSASSTSSTSSTSSSSSTTSSSSTSSASSGSQVATDTASNPDTDDEHLAASMQFSELLELLLQTRVLDKSVVQKNSQLHLVLVEYKEDDPRRFRRNLRVSPSTFDELVTRIEDDSIFQNRSNRMQYPVDIQLALALYRFGHDGNAASVEGVAQWAGVSVGLVVKATRRVMVAFLRLHDSIICWPSKAEREEAKCWVESVSCPAWQDGFCMVDGTLVPLFEKPGHHGEAYFDRKSNYSLNVQVLYYIIISL